MLVRETTPVLLFLSNADALPYLEAQGLLTRLRELVTETEGRLVVALTGEVDLQEFVEGPQSPFNCGKHFVVQRSDRELFDSFAERHCRNIGVSLDTSALDELFRFTNGALDQLRLFVWSMGEHWSLPEEDLRFVVASELPKDIVTRTSESGLVAGFLRTLIPHIERRPETWDTLRRLFEGERMTARGSSPTLLELVGVVSRESDGTLGFSSPLAERATRAYFSDRRLADLFVQHGDWKQAISYYDRLPSEARRRPFSLDDVAGTERVVRNLCHQLYREALGGSKELVHFLQKGLASVLGTTSVTL